MSFFPIANVSTSSTTTACPSCTYLGIFPDLASWAPQNDTPAIRTLQPIVDPNDNTTITSTFCNSEALSSINGYRTIGGNEFYNVNKECELYYQYIQYWIDGYPRNRLTITGTSGTALEIAGIITVIGAITTTDAIGSSACIESWYTRITEPRTYTGAVTTVPFSVVWTWASPDPWTSTGTGWLLPGITDVFPGWAAFEQCTIFKPDAVPHALTPAYEVVRPLSFLPYTGVVEPPLPWSSDPPANDPGTALPASTTSIAHPTAPTGSNQEPAPTKPVDPAPQGPTSNAGPGNSEGQQPPEEPTDKPGDPVVVPPSNTARPPAPSTNSAQPPAPGNSPDDPSIPPIQPLPAQTAPRASPGRITTTIRPQPGGIVEPAPTGNGGGITIAPTPTVAPGGGFVLPSQTITAGGPAAITSGTTFTILPSGYGVVAISAGGSTTVPLAQATRLGLQPILGQSGAFVLPAQTLVGGGAGVVVGGTTYSALGSGRGIVVAAGGMSTTIPAAAAGTAGTIVVPGLGLVQVLDGLGSGYVLDGSTTIVPGGAAATISGTVYTALPSGAGVMAIADATSGGYVVDGTATLMPGGPAATISGVIYSALPSGGGIVVVSDESMPGISGASPEECMGEDGYVVASTATICAGGSAITLSGTTYSALPSGDGVLVIGGGVSTTIDVDSGADGTGTDESVAAFTGGSSTWCTPLDYLRWTLVSLLFQVVLVLAC